MNMIKDPFIQLYSIPLVSIFFIMLTCSIINICSSNQGCTGWLKCGAGFNIFCAVFTCLNALGMCILGVVLATGGAFIKDAVIGAISSQSISTSCYNSVLDFVSGLGGGSIFVGIVMIYSSICVIGAAASACDASNSEGQTRLGDTQGHPHSNQPGVVMTVPGATPGKSVPIVNTYPVAAGVVPGTVVLNNTVASQI